MDPKEMAVVLQELLDRGFRPPIYFAAIAVNGSMIGGEYTADDGEEGLACNVLAQHVRGQIFNTPINTMFVDGHGAAARVVFDTSGKHTIMN
jgi:hypothetical protein